MLRISGVIIPDNKPLRVALTAIYGVGPSITQKILTQANISESKRTSELTDQEENRIRSIIEQSYKVEGDLRSVISSNIRRLKDIGSYRGVRHSKNLPVHGQRTKTNARTKRGKKVSVGSGRRKASEKT
ncbi:30S ribosomal protein S13 [Candidatus Berkelbacteria bacterium CG06_land_8_20_14_3_00_43_10]|uniref:Small ribosomal subunit protein uS13 n=1 Tax=Candidatus Berkelbacteria bacterium CG10_big_fil_rev_8_21_14_0_10_43_14 TaxID=1974515 RepID=A0A2M6RA66_9BACT|nr:MAG: 30S ribosomal protein S13 [Candidatus Berkelbacteria bacterium CG2_30_43_20]PIS06930.1 MAG: 30S ribosomal protein S13 [Candidatus Berkelbacteria bacterium CG10_big_fil_rev_8_21_14_0_10_43_14]PIU87389.1 MAG: 30S ribosomal protein S13 [Candidatus Berkelbacteria bacterium CG06_land_8_20_14_3_00_43_10]